MSVSIVFYRYSRIMYLFMTNSLRKKRFIPIHYWISWQLFVLSGKHLSSVGYRCVSLCLNTLFCVSSKRNYPKKRLAISNDVTRLYQIIGSITIQLDSNVRLIHKIIKTPNKTFTSTSIHCIEIIIYVNVRTKAEGQKKGSFFLFSFKLLFWFSNMKLQ